MDDSVEWLAEEDILPRRFLRVRRERWGEWRAFSFLLFTAVMWWTGVRWLAIPSTVVLVLWLAYNGIAWYLARKFLTIHKGGEDSWSYRKRYPQPLGEYALGVGKRQDKFVDADNDLVGILNRAPDLPSALFRFGCVRLTSDIRDYEICVLPDTTQGEAVGEDEIANFELFFERHKDEMGRLLRCAGTVEFRRVSRDEAYYRDQGVNNLEPDRDAYTGTVGVYRLVFRYAATASA